MGSRREGKKKREESDKRPSRVTNTNVVSEGARPFVRVSYLAGDLNYPCETKFVPLLGIVTRRWVARPRVVFQADVTARTDTQVGTRIYDGSRTCARQRRRIDQHSALSPTTPCRSAQRRMSNYFCPPPENWVNDILFRIIAVPGKSLTFFFLRESRGVFAPSPATLPLHGTEIINAPATAPYGTPQFRLAPSSALDTYRGSQSLAPIRRGRASWRASRIARFRSAAEEPFVRTRN